MKEWRARLESWPKESPRTASAGSIPTWVRSPARLREVRREILWSPVVIGLGFGIPLALAALLTVVLEARGNLIPSIMLVGLALAFTNLVAAGRWSEERFARRRARRAMDALGDLAGLDAEAVGVAYADGIWRNALFGDSWDWGALRLGFDRIEFVGAESRFALRPEDVVGVEVRRSTAPLGGATARLYLRYRGTSGIETVGIEMPYVRSARRRVERIDELRSRIERWRLNPLPALDAHPSLLPLGGEPVRIELSKYEQIGRLAKLLALLAVIPLAAAFNLVIFILLNLLRFSSSGGFMIGFFALYVVVWMMLAERIERRLPARHRVQKPMELGEAKVEPDAAIQQVR